MTSCLLLVFLTFAGCGQTGVGTPVGDPLDIIRTLPHDRSAYTQGFLYHDGVFYESTGLYGESTVRRVDVESGEVLQSHALSSEYFGEGLTRLGDRLYQLTWRERTGFIYDIDTLEPIGTFRYDSDGWGLATDGTYLILSDGTYLLRFIDPANFQVVRTLEVTDSGRVVSALNELEWVRGEIWANVYEQDRIVRIDPGTGEVVGWLDTTDLRSWWDDRRGAEVANGIAYDPETDRLWVTGKRWPHVFEVARPGDP